MKTQFQIALLFLFATIHFNAFNQTTWNWTRTINGPTIEDEIDAICSDSYGNVYSSGKFEDSILIQGQSQYMVSEGMADIMVIKHDRFGDLIWTKQFGNIGEDNTFDAVCDNDNNIILSGYFQNTIQFGTFTLVSQGGFDAFILKMNENGDVLWAFNYGGNSDDGGNEVSIGPNNQIITSAESTGSFTAGSFSFNLSGFKDSYLLSISTSGNVDWVRSIEGPGSARGKSVAVDNVGNIYFGGDFTGSKSAVDPSGTYPLTVYGAKDAFLTAWTPNGDFKWLKSWGGIGDDLCKGLTVNNQNEIFALGPFENSVDFEGTTLISDGQIDYFLWKIDSTSNVSWLRQLKSTYTIYEGGEIETDGDNGVVFGLGMYGNIHFEDDNNNFISVSTPTLGSWPSLVRYNENGSFNSATLVNYSQFATFGEITRSNNLVYLDLIYYDSLIVGNDTILTDPPTNQDAAIVSCTIDNSSSIAQNEKPIKFKAYPNPTSDKINIALDNQYYTIKIIDINSTVLVNLKNQTNLNSFDLNHLSPGVYYILISNSSKKYVQKIIKL